MIGCQWGYMPGMALLQCSSSGRLEFVQVSADVADDSGGGYLLRSTATTVKFPGYLAVYPPKSAAGA